MFINRFEYFLLHKFCLLRLLSISFNLWIIFYILKIFFKLFKNIFYLDRTINDYFFIITITVWIEIKKTPLKGYHPSIKIKLYKLIVANNKLIIKITLNFIANRVVLTDKILIFIDRCYPLPPWYNKKCTQLLLNVCNEILKIFG